MNSYTYRASLKKCISSKSAPYYRVVMCPKVISNIKVEQHVFLVFRHYNKDFFWMMPQKIEYSAQKHKIWLQKG